MSTELSAPPRIEPDPIGTALVKAGITSAAIENLAQQYGELAKLPEVTTEEEYEQVHRAQLAHRDIRVAVVATLKAEREEAVRYQKLVVSEEKRIVGLIEQTEGPLKKLKDDWNHKAELKALEEAKKWQERMNLRKQAAFDIGYYFNGQHYLLDRENGEAPWVLNEDQLAGLAMSDETLFALLDAQAAELKLTREIKAEAEAKAEDERLAKEAAAKAEADRIAAAQAEIERKEREMAEKERRMNERINEVRKAELIAMGMRPGQWSDCVFLTREGGGYTYPTEQLHTFDDWEAEKLSLRPLISGRDLHEREDQERQEQERIAREEQLREEAAAEALRKERLRQAAEQERKEKEDAIRAQQEAERIAQAGDKGKVEALCDELEHIKIPELDSPMGQHGMARVRYHLDKLIKMAESIAKDL